MYILGISAYYHDSAACLLKDDHIVAAAQQERFSRIKNDSGFPDSAIRYCLKEGGIQLRDLDLVVYYEKPFLKFERLLDTYFSYAPRGLVSFIRVMSLWLKGKLFLKNNIIKALGRLGEERDVTEIRLLFSDHHLSHAASAYYPSPFQRAVIVTADGVGEWTTTSVSLAEGTGIRRVKEINFPHSIGLLYSAFTYYLGFKVNSDEYKVMGLAPFGKPVYKKLIYEHLIDVKADGSFRLDMRYFDYCTGFTMTSPEFERLFNGPRRVPTAELTEFYMDVAASIQAVTEDILLKITRAAHAQYPMVENLCLAGGVALNCVANAKIVAKSGFKNYWIQPAAGDAGGALGAALAAYYRERPDGRVIQFPDSMHNALLGPSFADDEIMCALREAGLDFTVLSEIDYYRTIARHIADGKIVGYFKGRAEFGPRALGARSILADPRNDDMQSLLNEKIKFRESFRPFAPAVLEEYVPEWFDCGTLSPYMLIVGDVAEKRRLPLGNEDELASGLNRLKIVRSEIPAVTHVDYSARIQTVSSVTHPDFYHLISAFFSITGVPVVLNTSFNRMDEPIVCTPAEAIACFRETGMDILVMGAFLVIKDEGSGMPAPHGPVRSSRQS